MINSPFKEEHIQFRSQLKKYISNEIEPNINQWIKEGFPLRDIISGLGHQGFLKQTIDESIGGMGKDYWFNVILHEELANIPSGVIGMSVASHLDIATSILINHASQEVRNEWGRAAILGEKVLGLALTEPQAGSDLAAIKTSAIQDCNEYIINGEKFFINNGVSADALCVLARTSSENSLGSYTLFLVPKEQGVTTKNLMTLGNRGDIASISFKDVRVPKNYILGGVGQGFIIQMSQFIKERAIIAVRMAAMAEYHLNMTINHCHNRVTFEQKLSGNQAIQHSLAMLLTEVEQVKQLTYACIVKMIKGEEATSLAAMAKLSGSRLVRRLADTCLQYFGGIGYLEDHPISRFYRDSRALSLAGGTDEMMLNIVTKKM
jgi:citronellyl-CoA dehydrogenase